MRPPPQVWPETCGVISKTGLNSGWTLRVAVAENLAKYSFDNSLPGSKIGLGTMQII